MVDVNQEILSIYDKAVIKKLTERIVQLFITLLHSSNFTIGGILRNQVFTLWHNVMATFGVSHDIVKNLLWLIHVSVSRIHVSVNKTVLLTAYLRKGLSFS